MSISFRGQTSTPTVLHPSSSLAGYLYFCTALSFVQARNWWGKPLPLLALESFRAFSHSRQPPALPNCSYPDSGQYYPDYTFLKSDYFDVGFDKTYIAAVKPEQSKDFYNLIMSNYTQVGDAR